MLTSVTKYITLSFGIKSPIFQDLIQVMQENFGIVRMKARCSLCYNTKAVDKHRYKN